MTMSKMISLLVIALALSDLGAIIPAIYGNEVDVSVYFTKINKFHSEEYATALTSIVTEYCAGDNNECPGGVKQKNITADVSNPAKDGNNLKFQVILTVVETSGKLEKPQSFAILNATRDDINLRTGHQIVSIGEKKYGIKPDDPNNWIISGIVLAIVLVMAGVTIYLAKHKVDHAAEHHHLMKEMNSNGDGAHNI